MTLVQLIHKLQVLQKQHGNDTDAVVFPNSSLQIDSNLV